MSHGRRTDAIAGAMLFFLRSLLLLVSLLDADEEKVLVGGDHNFLFAGTNPEESKVVKWVDVSHNGSGLLRKLGDFLSDHARVGSVLARLHSGAKDFAVLVDDKETFDTLVVTDSVNSFFDFCHFNL